jgi:uncharacterized membrane protein YheB (UPF0754 family)
MQRLLLSAGQYEETLRDKMPEIINDIITQFQTMALDPSLEGKLLIYVSDLIRFQLDDPEKMVDALISLADKHAEELLKTINIKALVADRINSLDMLSVERIILDVMSNQFKWIDIFGAILGALIGLAQVLVQRFLLT